MNSTKFGFAAPLQIDIRQKLGTQRFSEFHSFRWHKLLRGGCKCYKCFVTPPTVPCVTNPRLPQNCRGRVPDFSRFQSAIFQVFSHTQMSIFQVLNVVFPTKSAIFQVPAVPAVPAVLTAIQLVLLYFIITTTTIKEFGKYLRVASNSNSNVSEAECRDFGSKSGAKSATRRRRRHIDCAVVTTVMSYREHREHPVLFRINCTCHN